jgi:hypothetical protein
MLLAYLVKTIDCLYVYRVDIKGINTDLRQYRTTMFDLIRVSLADSRGSAGKIERLLWGKLTLKNNFSEATTDPQPTLEMVATP